MKCNESSPFFAYYGTNKYFSGIFLQNPSQSVGLPLSEPLRLKETPIVSEKAPGKWDWKEDESQDPLLTTPCALAEPTLAGAPEPERRPLLVAHDVASDAILTAPRPSSPGRWPLCSSPSRLRVLYLYSFVTTDTSPSAVRPVVLGSHHPGVRDQFCVLTPSSTTYTVCGIVFVQFMSERKHQSVYFGPSKGYTSFS